MNKTRVGLAMVAGLLGALLGRMTGAWGFESGWSYAILADALLVGAVFAAFNRMARRTIGDSGVGSVALLAVGLFGISMLVAQLGSSASDVSTTRYVVVAAAFVPLACITHGTHQRWNAFAPTFVLVFVPMVTAIAVGMADGVAVRMSPLLFIIVTIVAVLVANTLPTLPEKRTGQIETGLAMVAAFLTGVTTISSSYDYDLRAAVLIGVVMTVVGWLLGVMLRRWNAAPSQVLNWQNLVVGVWIGQFMPGAAVMTAIALFAGWVLYGTTRGIGASVRKNRERQERARS